MFKLLHRIPTEQYAYIEFNKEYDSIDEAMAEHVELCSKYNDPGLPEREWAQHRNKMFITGEFDVNIEGLSKAQRYFINQCKLALRATKNEEPVIN